MTGESSKTPDPIDEANQGFDESGVGESVQAPPGEHAGDVIDRYKLIKVIGEGGMGSVWLAEQSEPIRRKVALKVIKLGMDTREVIGRFNTERQALAMMDHPNIAKVLDGGVTELGRPFFVMELVHGTTITDYCDKAQLGLRDRLDLFVKVCGAIQHAHQKGIVHRDIKPANVLIALQDGVPEPKVIDFGIAKATSAELTQKTLFTQFAQIVGTPEYMAPEQAGGTGLDIDTRADVYSLGVLLYELLTGTKPFDLHAALEVGYGELMRTIREVDPVKPSTRVSGLGETGPSIADSRHVNVESLSKRLRGDLDWIVMKALEKDRGRRYATATGFAEDISRYLRQEPVLAAPPSTPYRLSRLLRRHRKTVIAVAAFVLLLIAGSVGTGLGWWKTQQANRALNVALVEKQDALESERQQRALAEQNEKRATEAQLEAKRNEKVAREVADFLNEDLLGAIAPEQEGIDVTVREVLAIASVRLDRRFDKEPLVEAELRRTIGTSFERLGDYTTARGHLERAYDLLVAEHGERDQRTLATALLLGSIWSSVGRFEDAAELQQRTLEICNADLGPNHPMTLQARELGANTAWARGELDSAAVLFEELETVLRREMGDRNPITLSTIASYSQVLLDLGHLEQAEALQAEALDAYRKTIGEGNEITLTAADALGEIYVAQGRTTEAEKLLLDTQATRERVLGPDHPATANGLGRLGIHYFVQGRAAEAEKQFARGYEMLQRVLGSEHRSTLQMANNLAGAWSALGRGEESLALRQATLEAERRTLGPEHPYTLTSLGNLGTLLQSLGRLDEAEAVLQETLTLNEKVLGADNPITWTMMENLSGVLLAQGKLEESQALTERVLEARKHKLGPEHPKVARTLYNLGVVSDYRNEPAAARARFEEAIEVGQSSNAVDVISKATGYIALLDYNENEYAKAMAGCTEAIRVRRSIAIEDLEIGDWLYRAGRCAKKLEDFPEAARFMAEALALRSELLGEAHLDTLKAHINLARMLQACGRFEEAEVRALEVHGILLKSDGEGSDRVVQARNLLEALYEAWERPDQAALWRD